VHEALPTVSADEEALAQAVTNLLDNAVKYSGQARRVIVRAFVKERHLAISVQDFGVGIKKEDTGRVFERFYRGGDELTRSVKGSGLGLTLVKEIVAAHHGTVHVDSEPGRGSTFTIRLPTSTSQESGVRERPARWFLIPESRFPIPFGAAMSRILIVEDEDAILLPLADNLRLEGYEVSTATDGRQGFALAQEKPHDLLILDIMLPGMDGFEICRKLRQAGVRIPILMLTAKSQEIDKVLGLELGADDYVTKPFSSRELLARVKALLRRTREPQPDIGLCTFGNVEVDFKKYEARKHGKPIFLTALEYSLLRCLIAHKGEVVSRDGVLDEVWGESVYVDPRTVDKHISSLRKKIEDDPDSPKHIVGVRGVGYRFAG
jgi:DNA-binding response OmpR family regulator/anti-sigma regulatory factor (Ser/Thr protein kinase)